MRRYAGMPNAILAAVTAACTLCVAPQAPAQPDPSGIDFVTIGAVGNGPWQGNGDPDDMAVGRGRVDYEYRIGRMEVTTAQWVEFFNAAYDRPVSDRLPHLFPPDHWGAVGTTPNTPGGLRWRVPTGNENLPVGDISWRMAAMYANWLHNDKRTDRAAFLDGAYDVSTFGFQGSTFTDQLAHRPGARYWIPTWDEWLKAAHYDPDKVNPDGSVGGWWSRPNGTDAALAYGPPGQHVRTVNPPGPDPNGPLAQANAAWSNQFPGFSPFAVPLGAYATVTSPWGLLDVAGGTSEWTEEVLRTNGIWPTWRALEGSAWTANSISDRLSLQGPSEFPNTALLHSGLRIASVPSLPTCTMLALGGIVCWGLRLRRRPSDADQRGVRFLRGAWGGGRTGLKRRRRRSSIRTTVGRRSPSSAGRTSRSTSGRSPGSNCSASTTRPSPARRTMTRGRSRSQDRWAATANFAF